MVPPVFLRPFDVPALRALVAAAEQNHHGVPLSPEVHPVAGAGVDAKLLHALADRAGIPKVPKSNPSDALADTVASASIPKPSEPLCERLRAVRAGIDPDLLLDRRLGNVA